MHTKKEMSMNLMKMSPEERLAEIRAAKARMEEELMDNDPITNEADYLDFIIEGYAPSESEAQKVGNI